MGSIPASGPPRSPLSVRSLLRHPAFRDGVRDMAMIAAGMATWGVMTGVAMVKSGMATGEVLLMAVLVFAGSSQLAALPLIVSGAPMWVVLATGFCVNLRFVVFSAHLRPYVMHRRLWTRIAGGYLMADLNYVLFTRRFPFPAADASGIASQDAYWLGLGVTAWTSWTVPSLVGMALGNSVPLSWGLGFAGILALVGILCSLVTTGLRTVAAGVAGAAAIATWALPLKLNIVTAIAVAVALCLLAEASGSARRALLERRA